MGGAVFSGSQPMVMGGSAVIQQPNMVVQRPSMVVQQPMVMQQPMMRRVTGGGVAMPMAGVAGGLVQGPLPIGMIQPQVVMQQPQMMVSQPRIMIRQQPQMVVQRPSFQMIQQPGMQVQNLGTQVQDIQVSPYVTERHVIQQTKKIFRKTRKPVRKQIGTQMVPTYETVQVKNPDTMNMKTEYAEPYIKRDGFETNNVGTVGKAKVIRRTSGANTVVTRRTSIRQPAPIVTNQVSRIGMQRGYTRIDTWKHVGDAQ